MFHMEQRGFTLIELALSLLIIGMILGAITVPFITQIKTRQYESTQKQLNETREAIMGFAAINGRLPRPAVSATNGAEVASCATETTCTGFIPWVTLGVQKLDPYGKIIRYSVTPAYTNTFSLATAGTKTIMERMPNSPFSLVSLSSGVPAIVYSHGASSWGTGETGAAMADLSTTNADEDLNQTAVLAFVCRPLVENPDAVGGEFDDVCAWISRSALAGKMISAGKLP